MAYAKRCRPGFCGGPDASGRGAAAELLAADAPWEADRAEGAALTRGRSNIAIVTGERLRQITIFSGFLGIDFYHRVGLPKGICAIHRTECACWPRNAIKTYLQIKRIALALLRLLIGPAAVAGLSGRRRDRP